jgi:putative ABC transport system permease protein
MVRRAERLYRTLLHAYPREFRAEYGEEMSLLFRDRAADGQVWLWIQVAGDLLVHAPREHWSVMSQDLLYAFRTWRRAPAIPAVALTALIFGMGVNIAIFSVVHAVLLRPLPLPAPHDLVLLGESSPARGIENTAVSLPNYLSWRTHARSVDLAAFSGQNLTWTGPEYPERLEALAPTASFLDVVGAPLQAGRWFTAAEEQRGQHQVVVLSDTLWRTRFGAASNVVGQQLVLNGNPYIVIGVATASLALPSEPDVWVPQVVDQAASTRANRYLQVVGRVKPGFTREQADAELRSIAASLATEFPDSNRDFSIRMIPFTDSFLTEEVRTALILLLAAAGMVLLIACANVANVLLSRAAARRKEVAIRVALGAGGARITRQLLTESLCLAIVGTAIGLVFAAGILVITRGALVNVIPRIEMVALNLPVLLFGIGLALVTGVVCGLAPLRHVRQAPDVSVLHTGREDHSPLREHGRTMLVVGQIALTTMLLVGAGLLLQSLWRLQSVPVGINPDAVLSAKLSLTRSRLPNGTAINDFLLRLTSDLESSPGIRMAGISSAIPLSPGAYTITQAAGEGDAFVTCEWRLVDGGYFDTLQIPLLGGRLFTAHDTASSPRVFVISEQTARTLYGARDPIGRRLRLENGNAGEIIGVVADVRMRDLGDHPERVVYMPPSQFGFFPLFNVVVRTDGAPESAVDVVRDRLKRLDPNLAAYEIQRMQHWLDHSAAPLRIRTVLITSLGLVALVLGVIGIYGVMSYVVSQRAHEFGVRVALGARPWAIPLSVVMQALRLTIVGLGLGLVAASVLVQQMRSLLFDIDPLDPIAFGSAALVVGVVALLASYIPARRATTADPLVVLRAQ